MILNAGSFGSSLLLRSIHRCWQSKSTTIGCSSLHILLLRGARCLVSSWLLNKAYWTEFIENLWYIGVLANRHHLHKWINDTHLWIKTSLILNERVLMNLLMVLGALGLTCDSLLRIEWILELEIAILLLLLVLKLSCSLWVHVGGQGCLPLHKLLLSSFLLLDEELSCTLLLQLSYSWICSTKGHLLVWIKASLRLQVLSLECSLLEWILGWCDICILVIIVLMQWKVHYIVLHLLVETIIITRQWLMDHRATISTELLKELLLLVVLKVRLSVVLGSSLLLELKLWIVTGYSGSFLGIGILISFISTINFLCDFWLLYKVWILVVARLLMQTSISALFQVTVDYLTLVLSSIITGWYSLSYWSIDLIWKSLFFKLLAHFRC